MVPEVEVDPYEKEGAHEEQCQQTNIVIESFHYRHSFLEAVKIKIIPFSSKKKRRDERSNSLIKGETIPKNMYISYFKNIVPNS